MGDNDPSAFGHPDASVLHFGVQKGAFLDPDTVFIQRIKHGRKATEIEVFLLKNQMNMYYLNLSHIALFLLQIYQITLIWKNLRQIIFNHTSNLYSK